MNSEALFKLFKSMLTRKQYGFSTTPTIVSEAFSGTEMVPIEGAERVPEEDENRLKLASYVLEAALKLRAFEMETQTANGLADVLRAIDGKSAKSKTDNGGYA